MDELLERFETLYPADQSSVARIECGLSNVVGEVPSTVVTRYSPLSRLRTLLKGGLFLRYCQLGPGADFKLVPSRQSKYLFSSRNFFGVETSDSEIFLGHIGTGFMADLHASALPGPGNQIIEFISKILEPRAATTDFGRKRGLFVVLVGLDGSGKTTVARKLCCLAGAQKRFKKVRYFHWLPRLGQSLAFPLPDLNPTPRKPKLAPHACRSLLSIARLFKNIVLTNIAYWLRIRRLLRRNSLILSDRYYYNYYLDPASVKYAGPSRVLYWAQRFFPPPDLVVVLKTPPEVLRSRKQELSEHEILQQSEILHRLQFRARTTLEVDASLPALDVARNIMDKVVHLANERES